MRALRKLQLNPSSLDRLFDLAYSKKAAAASSATALDRMFNAAYSKNASSATADSNAEDAPVINEALIEETAAETTNAQTEETYVQLEVSASIAVTFTPDTEGTRHFSYL
jgi:hypothetical protein